MAAVGLLVGRQNFEQVRQWTRARSVSEAVKTEVFLFLTQSSAYEASDREARLEAEVQRMEQEAGDLLRYTEGVQPKNRPLPAVTDLGSYLDVRVRQSQLEGGFSDFGLGRRRVGSNWGDLAERCSVGGCRDDREWDPGSLYRGRTL
jgi:hypothetical protein